MTRTPVLAASGAARAIALIGDAWVLRILRSVFRGSNRFSGLLQELGVSRAVLILMWLWERQRGSGLAQGGHRSDRPRSRLIHRDCGATIEPRYACVHCAQAVSPFETEPVLRPQAGSPAPGLLAPGERARYRQSSRTDRDQLPRLLRLHGDRWKALGFLQARAYAGQRQEYRLTPDALATFAITVEMMQWGNRWLWRGQAPLTVRHKGCGHLLKAALDCPHCHKPLSRRNLMLLD